MKALFTFLLFAALTVRADIFSQVGKIESLDAGDTTAYDALNTKEFVSPVLYLGERNPRFELAQNLRPRLDALEIRTKFPDAWQMYSQGEIEEFSYFGFKLYDVERGRTSLEDFLKELQTYINHK